MRSMTRRILFWTHLALGVAAGAAILVMSATGVLLAFERQALQLVEADQRTVGVPPSAPKRPLAELFDTATASAGARPSGVILRPEPAASVEFAFGREGLLYVDPYTGTVLGEGSKAARVFFGDVERWHRTLGEPLGARGPLRTAAAAANLLFLLLVVTGPFLWLPRSWSWTATRAALLFRPGLRGRARDWNWHNVAGIWCAFPLLVITLTGVVISYPWANALLFRLAGSPAPVRQEPARAPQRDEGGREASRQPLAADLDAAAAVAGAQRAGWRSLSLRVPAGGETSVVVTLDAGSGGQAAKRTELVVDSRAGNILRVTRFEDRSLGQRLRALVRFLHTGEEAGLAGQLAAALASAAGALLVWTGLSLALRRLRAARG